VTKLKQIVVVLPTPNPPGADAGVAEFFKERVYIDKKAEKMRHLDTKGIDRWRLRLAYMAYCKMHNIYPVTGQSFAHACRYANFNYWGWGVRLREIAFR
jgi:hypothetical protein